MLPEVETASAQCQRWRQRRHIWQLAHPGERFDSRQYEVNAIDDDTAKTYCLEHHYSGSYPAAIQRFGLFRASRLVGIAVFSLPTRAAVLTNALPGCVPVRESLELGRFVLADAEPGNAESWFLARCHEALANLGLRGVVSFADPVPRVALDGVVVMPGHRGIIYQASGAQYAGRSTPRTLWLLPNGLVLNERTKQKIRAQESGHEAAERYLILLGARPMRAGQDPTRWLVEVRNDLGVRLLRHRGCHRYVFRLGTTRRERQSVQIGLPTRPYPKVIDLAA